MVSGSSWPCKLRKSVITPLSRYQNPLNEFKDIHHQILLVKFQDNLTLLARLVSFLGAGVS